MRGRDFEVVGQYAVRKPMLSGCSRPSLMLKIGRPMSEICPVKTWIARCCRSCRLQHTLSLGQSGLSYTDGLAFGLCEGVLEVKRSLKAGISLAIAPTDRDSSGASDYGSIERATAVEREPACKEQVRISRLPFLSFLTITARQSRIFERLSLKSVIEDGHGTERCLAIRSST